jgi:hypothetical protein
MKIINLSLIVMLMLSATLLAQKGKWQDEEARERFEQLEKIKLIETLGMDEETTLRFFARRSEHRKQQDEIQEKIRQKIDNLDAMLKSGKVASVEEIKTNINEINNLQLQFDKGRVDFVNSLSEILSYEQIAKLVIFEKRFKNELRKLLIKERRPPIDPE